MSCLFGSQFLAAAVPGANVAHPLTPMNEDRRCIGPAQKLAANQRQAYAPQVAEQESGTVALCQIGSHSAYSADPGDPDVPWKLALLPSCPSAPPSRARLVHFHAFASADPFHVLANLLMKDQ